MAKKQTHMGYPGVFPSPDDQDPPEKGEQITIISSDATNSLIKDSRGDTRVVPNSQIQR